MNKTNAYIVTNAMTPLNKSGEVTISKFIRVIKDTYEIITIIGGNVSIEKNLNDVIVKSYDFNKAGNKLSKIKDMYSLQRKMSSYIKNNVKDKDHVFFWIGDKMILPFLASKKKTKHVGYFVYGNTALDEKQNLFTKISTKLIEYMANHADRLYVEAKSVRDSWDKQLKKEANIIHLYVDNIVFNPIENRENRIGMLSRLASSKHVKEIIKAFNKIHETHKDYSLDLIGSGVQEEECKKLIEELSAQSYISVYGWQDANSINEISNKWKWNILVSDYEGLPNSLIEMMGKGIPTIATLVGGIKDILKDKVNGIALKGTSVEDIVEGFEEAFKMNNYEDCCKNAYKTISEEYSLKAAKEKAFNELSNWN